jgi:hypothetical protein
MGAFLLLAEGLQREFLSVLPPTYRRISGLFFFQMNSQQFDSFRGFWHILPISFSTYCIFYFAAHFSLICGFKPILCG